MRIRLMFEPEPNVNINNNETFRHYGENYLADFPAEYAGFVMLDATQSKYDRKEPLYQFIIEKANDRIIQQIKDYIQKNPMHGYYTHISIEGA